MSTPIFCAHLRPKSGTRLCVRFCASGPWIFGGFGAPLELAWQSPLLLGVMTQERSFSAFAFSASVALSVDADEMEATALFLLL